jgi:hypothetical protein
MIKSKLFANGFVAALFFCACNNNTVEKTVTLTAEQEAIVKNAESIFEAKKDSLKKHYDSLLHSSNISVEIKDSLKQEKKKSQLALKLEQTELLAATLSPEQLIALEQQKEKKQETVEEKIAKKMAKLKEEYSLSAQQEALILPIVTRAEKAKFALKQQYPGEGKDKSPEVKAAEKKAKDAIDATQYAELEKIFTPEQNKILGQKLAEKKQKEMEKKKEKE